jgi:hypothetical protein
MSQNSRQAKNNGGRFFPQHKMPLSKYRKCRPSKMLRGLFEAFIGKLCLSLSKENFAISQVSKVGSTLLLLVEGVSGLLLCNTKIKYFLAYNIRRIGKSLSGYISTLICCQTLKINLANLHFRVE